MPIYPYLWNIYVLILEKFRACGAYRQNVRPFGTNTVILFYITIRFAPAIIGTTYLFTPISGIFEDQNSKIFAPAARIDKIFTPFV